MIDPRRMEHEGPLHAHPVRGDAADGEAGADPGLAGEADHHPLEDLDALASTLDDLDVHPHGVPAAKHRDLGLLLLPLEELDDVHFVPPEIAPDDPNRSGLRRRVDSML